MPEMMRAVLCRNPGDLEIVQYPVPERKPGEALVRIRRVGVCGTDMHIYQGNQPYFTYPRVMGHELSGEIVEADAGSALKAGDPVYIVPYLHCGHCIACRAGKTNCCTSLKVLGVHIDGGMCEYLSLPETHLFKADGITLDEAAMDLGSRPFQVFWDVTLPQSVPGIVAGGMLVFIPAAGELVIPSLVGNAAQPMIGKIIQDEFGQARDWPMASAVAVALLILMVIPTMIYSHYQAKAERLK